MNPNVAIITLNWNRWQDTIECLESLHDIDYENYDVILVDNASADESLTKIDAYCRNELKFVSHISEQVIRSKPTKVVGYHTACTETGTGPIEAHTQVLSNRALTVIQNDENYGFAEGNNIAVAYALNALHPDYVLLLNNDTVVDKHFLDELVNAAEHDGQIALLQPKILRSVDSTIESTGIVCDTMASSKFRGAYEKDEGQYDNDREDGFFYASGACVLIRKSLLATLSGECFDPHLFAYYEDVDLSWTARLIGLKVVYCPEAVCYHKQSATFGGETPLSVYLGNRNRLRVMIKNYSLRTLVFILPLTIVLRFSVSTFNWIVNYDSSYLVSFLRALCWNVLNLRSALVLRKSIQSKRKLRDHEIMRHMIPYSFRIRSALKRLVETQKE
jgi:GT2 family glycosyltransferase